MYSWTTWLTYFWYVISVPIRSEGVSLKERYYRKILRPKYGKIRGVSEGPWIWFGVLAWRSDFPMNIEASNIKKTEFRMCT